MENYSRNKTRRASSSSICSQQKRPIQRNTGQNKTKKQQKTHLLSSKGGKCLLLRPQQIFFQHTIPSEFCFRIQNRKASKHKTWGEVLPETCIQGKHTIPNQAFINAAKQKRKQKIYIFELNIVILLLLLCQSTQFKACLTRNKKQQTHRLLLEWVTIINSRRKVHKVPVQCTYSENRIRHMILSELFSISPKTGKQAGDMRDLLQRLSYHRAQQNSKPELVIKKSTNRRCKTEKVNRKWRAKHIMRSTRLKACFYKWKQNAKKNASKQEKNTERKTEKNEH